MLAIGLLVFAAYLFRGVFERTGVPDVLLLMLCGMAVGPLLGWVQPADFGQAGKALATMALVVILFEGGVDLDVSSLKPSIGPTLKLTLSTFVLTVAVVAALAHLLAGLPLLSAAMLGVILGGTSSAVVIPIVQGLALQGTMRSVLILESALTDVLCIVGLFVLLDAAQQGGVSVGHAALALSETMGVAALVGAAAGLAWLLALRAARKLPHGSFASAAACFVVYGLVEMAGFSGAIAALCFGLALANGRRFAAATGWLPPERLASFSSSEQGFLQEIIFVLKTFFFVYLGISMKLEGPTLFIIGAAMVGLVYLVRHGLVWLAIDSAVPRAGVQVAAVMVPKGLAAAVLAGLPLERGVAGGELIQSLAYVVVLLSIGLTAIMIPLQRTSPGASLYSVIYKRHPE
jgi:NhaP-type Na+/H+ or K+/H+ antiporter